MNSCDIVVLLNKFVLNARLRRAIFAVLFLRV